VWLDVRQPAAFRGHDGLQGADLVCGVVSYVVRGHVDAAASEAEHVREPYVGADGDAVLDGQARGRAHVAGVAGVESTGDVGGGDPRHHVGVVAESPATVALAHVEVDVHGGRARSAVSFGQALVATGVGGRRCCVACSNA